MFIKHNCLSRLLTYFFYIFNTNANKTVIINDAHRHIKIISNEFENPPKITVCSVCFLLPCNRGLQTHVHHTISEIDIGKGEITFRPISHFSKIKKVCFSKDETSFVIPGVSDITHQI